jgi:hypothetical protein
MNGKTINGNGNNPNGKIILGRNRHGKIIHGKNLNGKTILGNNLNGKTINGNGNKTIMVNAILIKIVNLMNAALKYFI